MIRYPLVSESCYKPTYDLKLPRSPSFSSDPLIRFSSVRSPFLLSVSACLSVVGSNVLRITFYTFFLPCPLAVPPLSSSDGYELSCFRPSVFANEAKICSGPFFSLSIFYVNYKGWVINSDAGNHVAPLGPLVISHAHAHAHKCTTSTQCLQYTQTDISVCVHVNFS